MRASRYHRGLTLLEVMVALALLAVVSVMASKGLTQVIRARDVVYDEQMRWRSIAMAWARVGEDVTTSVDGLPIDVSEARWQGRSGAAQWAVWGVAGSVLPIQYSLRNGTLFRKQGADLSRPRMSLPGAGREATNAPSLETPMLDGVRSIGLSFLDAQGVWHDQWPQEGTPYTRPRALRMILALDSGRDVTRIFALP